MRRVLLIERDTTLRTTFRHFLEEHGYEVVDAEDGDSALEACRASLPQIVITNLSATLRQPSNCTFVAALRKEFVELPIISTSGSLEETDRIEALGMGASIHLAKPIEATDLVESVDNLLDADDTVGAKLPQNTD